MLGDVGRACGGRPTLRETVSAFGFASLGWGLLRDSRDPPATPAYTGSVSSSVVTSIASRMLR